MSKLDYSCRFTKYDRRKTTSIEGLQKEVQKAYEGYTWQGIYDGSLGEAMDDGKIIAKIEMLYHLGRKIGLELIEPPDFYDDQYEKGAITWSGKNGITTVEEE